MTYTVLVRSKNKPIKNIYMYIAQGKVKIEGRFNTDFIERVE
jgi:hypothetical protein